jgi:predicted HicB family RNase H-like nuclease
MMTNPISNYGKARRFKFMVAVNEDERERAIRVAASRNISLSSFVRLAVQKLIESPE